MWQRDQLSRDIATWQKKWDDKKYYSELIFDSATFIKELPHSVEAMFFLPTNCAGDIYDGPKCESYARRAHRKFIEHFKLSPLQVPLLKFDLWNWDTPFSLAEPGDTTPTEPGP